MYVDMMFLSCIMLPIWYVWFRNPTDRLQY